MIISFESALIAQISVEFQTITLFSIAHTPIGSMISSTLSSYYSDYIEEYTKLSGPYPSSTAVTPNLCETEQHFSLTGK